MASPAGTQKHIPDPLRPVSFRGAEPGKPVAKWVIGVLFLLWAGLTAMQWQLFRVGGAESVTETFGAFALINVNILLLLLLVFLTMRNLAKLVLERRKGILGSKLKTRLVLTFLAVTVIPTFTLFLISAGFLASSIDGWFSVRVDQALENSLNIARAYYSAEEASTTASAKLVAGQLAALEGSHENNLEAGLEELLELYRLDAISIFYPDGSTVETLRPSAAPLFVDPNAEAIKSGFNGEDSAMHISQPDTDILRSIVAVNSPDGGSVTAVVVADRAISISSFRKMQEITKGYEEYRQTEHLRVAIKASYIFPLLIVALLIIFAGTWFGFHLSRTLTEPIGALADATQRIASGDMDFQLDLETPDELGTLVKSFNMMTRDLRQSREKVEAARQTLTEANTELESWRIYMETVMDKVTAGVVGTDINGDITTINPAAMEMLGADEDVRGKPYTEVLPPEALGVFESLADEKRKKRSDFIRRQIHLTAGGISRTVMVHLTTLRDADGRASGTVTVLNDLTDLVKAERAQAWREVARRVAHEIKNPLTPIQLSAQRVRRRYSDLLEESEGDALDEATRTIIAQVEGLKQLVNEFSRFAKMPESKPVPVDLNKIVEEVVSLYRPAHSDITFQLRVDETIPTVEMDPEQIKRTVVNLLDNAVSALEGEEHGFIEVDTQHEPHRQMVRMVISDNGPGLTPKARESLFEPYFSTKKGGTGLGLSIVKSIVADHRGYIRAVDNKPRGTRFILEFPLPGA